MGCKVDAKLEEMPEETSLLRSGDRRMAEGSIHPFGLNFGGLWVSFKTGWSGKEGTCEIWCLNPLSSQEFHDIINHYSLQSQN